MKIAAGLITCLILATPILSSAEIRAKLRNQSPGARFRETQAVWFAEGHKTSGHFYGVAITTKTVGKLILLEAQNYTFNQKEVLETQENLDNMMQMAQKDHVKFVKIPEKHSPELLEKARTICKADAQ